MKKQKDHWQELLPYERKFEVAAWVLCGLFFLVLALEMMAWRKLLVFPAAVDLLGGLLITAANGCGAVVYWRKKRNHAQVCILVAIVFGLGVLWDIVKLFI
ncbi:MAG: hypothetical protein IJ960_07620 [Oscillospiraceae bacterium]|nr:hypothetical protein [Oscillospiraceae bacterium]